MILISSKSKPLVTDRKKHHQKRRTLMEYSVEIDELYEAVENSIQSDIAIPNGVNPEVVGPLRKRGCMFMELILKGASEMQHMQDDDIFGFGCDRYVTFGEVFNLLFLI
jgi:hypothetical protein